MRSGTTHSPAVGDRRIPYDPGPSDPMRSRSPLDPVRSRSPLDPLEVRDHAFHCGPGLLGLPCGMGPCIPVWSRPVTCGPGPRIPVSPGSRMPMWLGTMQSATAVRNHAFLCGRGPCIPQRSFMSIWAWTTHSIAGRDHAFPCEPRPRRASMRIGNRRGLHVVTHGSCKRTMTTVSVRRSLASCRPEMSVQYTEGALSSKSRSMVETSS